MDYQQMTSPCGLDCFNCLMYLANEDMSLRAKISEKLNLSLEKAKGIKRIKEEKLVARHCHSEDGIGRYVAGILEELI